MLKTNQHDELRDEISRAEARHELSEFHALNFHALLAIIEGSDLAIDYLEMADASAGSPYELALVSESFAVYDLSNGNALSAARRCLNTLSHIQQTEGLWSRLLLALYRLGDVEAIDVTLEGFTKLDEESHGRLIDLISIEPDLSEIRQRPAFQQLIARRHVSQPHAALTNHDPPDRRLLA
ncbi:MAG: hypothetical protein ABIY55_11540 [Kofleriaceae bacterium]